MNLKLAKHITFKSVFIPKNNQKTNQQVLEEQDEETASPEERLNFLINLEQIEINSNNDLKLVYEALNTVYLIRKIFCKVRTMMILQFWLELIIFVIFIHKC